MVSVSTAFMAGLKDPDNHPQRMVFQFDNGTIISNEDIDVEAGVHFDEVWCSETDYTIGLTPSSEISFGLFNDDGHYNDFEFGTFNAYIGVMLTRTIDTSPTVQRPTITISDLTMTVVGNRKTETYELCPLGRFVAPRPAVVQTVLIDVSANDQMVLFDENLPSATDLNISYPVSTVDMFNALCTYVGVTGDDSTIAINRTLTMAQPKDTDTLTMREIIGWIAEAAGSTARFNREGVLECAVINPVGRVYFNTYYADYESAWYTVPQVDELHVRNADSTSEETIGGGNSPYMIQNNPFLV